jgi:hypothetical protein
VTVLAEVSWRPTVEQVASLIRARTKVRGGVEVGTFLDEDEDSGPTRPTRTGAEEQIDIAMRRVASAIGGYELCQAAVDDGLEDDAGGATAQYAAALIEQSYWPDQTSNPGSSFRSLMDLFKDSIKTLTEAVGERCGGTAGDGSGGGAHAIAKAGPPECGGVIGREGPVW